MTCLIGAYNFLDENLLNGYSYSSQQTEFPASNFMASRKRSKVWRTAGYWIVTSSNNTIVFQETGGVDLTATVAEGTYTSTSLLLAAIKDAMDLAGASSYTISVSQSKILITSNMFGGGNLFSLICSESTMTDMLGYGSSDLTGSAGYVADVVRIHNYEFITWDLGQSSNPTMFCLVGRSGGINFTDSAVIKLQGNSTSNFTTPDFETTLDVHSTAIVHINRTGIANTALRYWRLYVEDKSNPDGYLEFGACFLGNAFDPSQGAVSFPLSGDWTDNSVVTRAISGITFSEIRQKIESFDFEYNHLSASEKEEIDTFVKDVGISKPYFMVFDPTAVFSSSKEYYARYVRNENAPSWSYNSAIYFSYKFSVTEDL